MQTLTKTCDIKAISTGQLQALNFESIRIGLNRNLNDAFFKDADLGGEHVISIFMVHEHARGLPVAPHYRCQILAKLRRNTKPCHLVLDMPFTSWHALPRLPKQILRRLALVGREVG
jgi:hypothetical protein